MNAAPGVYQGAADVIAALMLLLEFGMLRQALVRDQVRLYAAQSAMISVLARSEEHTSELQSPC